MFAVSHLRFTWIWLSLGLLLTSAIVVLSMVNLTPLKGALLQDKVMHMLAYGLLMGWFAQIYRHPLARVLLVLGFVLLGVGIEYLQGMTVHREFDKLDMLANTAGIILAWLLSYTLLGRVFIGFERLLTR
jgi:glycopeptide antibiotics resistance protein